MKKYVDLLSFLNKKQTIPRLAVRASSDPDYRGIIVIEEHDEYGRSLGMVNIDPFLVTQVILAINRNMPFLIHDTVQCITANMNKDIKLKLSMLESETQQLQALREVHCDNIEQREQEAKKEGR